MWRVVRTIVVTALVSQTASAEPSLSIVDIHPELNAECPAIAIDAHQRVHLVFSVRRVNSFDYFHTSSVDGAKWSAPARITENRGAPCQAAIAVEPSGELAVAWAESENAPLNVFVSTSGDGGKTWREPGNISGRKRPPPSTYHDEVFLPYVVRVPDRVKAVPDERTSSAREVIITTGKSGIEVLWSDTGLSGVVGEHGFRSEVWRVVSSDHGATWSAPAIALTKQGVVQSLAAATSPSGAIAIAWTIEAEPTGHEATHDRLPIQNWIATSQDGTVWSEPVLVGEAGDSRPQIALSADGRVRVASVRESEEDADIVLRTSSDFGRTFDAPVTLSALLGQLALVPVMIASENRFVLSWIQLEMDTGLEIWMAHSPDWGRTFQRPLNLTPTGCATMEGPRTHAASQSWGHGQCETPATAITRGSLIVVWSASVGRLALVGPLDRGLNLDGGWMERHWLRTVRVPLAASGGEKPTP